MLVKVCSVDEKSGIGKSSGKAFDGFFVDYINQSKNTIFLSRKDFDTYLKSFGGDLSKLNGRDAVIELNDKGFVSLFKVL